MLLLWLIFAQTTAALAREAPARPPQALAIIDQVRALPAEFHADLLLRLADSSLVLQTPWKQELIEEAYWSGAHAFLPYAQNADGRSDSVVMNAARANGLEALTLQAKAVLEMLPLSPANARRLFEQIQPIALPKLDCSTALTPDPGIYYRTAVRVFENSFSGDQKEKGQGLAFLRQVVGSVQAPAQVPPALEMVFAVKLPADQRRDLLSLLAGQLDQISRSDREYSAAETELGAAINGMGLSDAAVLMPALRSYIVRQVSGRRCNDNLPSSGTLAKSAEDLNRLISRLDPTQARYKPISAEEAKPAGDNGTYRENLFGQSPQSEAITEALRWLTHGGRARNGKVLRWSLKERSSREWLNQYDDAAKLVHDLKEGDESSPEAFFCMKSDALNLLASLAPPGTRREKAMDEYREFLEDYYPSIENRNVPPHAVYGPVFE